MANGPINAEIYTKGDLEGSRVTHERLLAKHKDKKSKALREYLEGKLEKIKEDIENIKTALATYNEEKSVNLELICV